MGRWEDCVRVRREGCGMVGRCGRVKYNSACCAWDLIKKVLQTQREKWCGLIRSMKTFFLKTKVATLNLWNSPAAPPTACAAYRNVTPPPPHSSLLFPPLALIQGGRICGGTGRKYLEAEKDAALLHLPVIGSVCSLIYWSRNQRWRKVYREKTESNLSREPSA